MENPCFDPITHKDCPRRKIGCATYCKEWATYVEKRNETYKKRSADADTDSYIIDSVEKRRKLTHKWGDKVE